MPFANNNKPYYDESTNTWRVDFPDRDSEFGDLLYVTCEYVQSSLFYPFHTSATIGKKYSGHGHSFESVIQALIEDPSGFTIHGFETYYSQQELDLLWLIQRRLLDMPCGTP